LEWERVSEVGLNDLAKISLAFSEAIPVRPFIKGGDQQLSTAILIDPSTNETVAAVWFDQGIEVDPLAQVAGVS
jgi:sulfate adenylyltransferase subunit 1 (EFTu-like GTPase family)